MAEFDSVIPAGGTGTLTAKIKTTSTQNGPVSKGIAVNTNAAGAERLMLVTVGPHAGHRPASARQ